MTDDFRRMTVGQNDIRYAAGQIACDLLEDQNGNWWIIHLATRPDEAWYSHLGRETFLLPVIWENEWPVVGDGASRIVCDGPLWEPQKPTESWQADFSFCQPQWLFLRRPRWENYDFQGDKLQLTPSEDHLSDPLGRPTFLALRQMDVNCMAEAEMDFDPVCDGNVFFHFYPAGKHPESGQILYGIRTMGGSRLPLVLHKKLKRVSFCAILKPMNICFRQTKERDRPVLCARGMRELCQH